ncbi:hypothetical protein HYW75_00555 [Candidatus Pacearchaeota archaeon]|nr:hypothetical protein [Candidatus Pacearchaeota archaeon]
MADNTTEGQIKTEEEKLIEERKAKVVQFVKLKKSWFIYILLALLIYFSIWIRTLNVDGLKDVTTGAYTLGPDLDPFLFLRWAKEIIASGSLSDTDPMRYVPLGFKTKEELVFLSYMIAFFHKIASSLGSTSVDQSAVLFPAYMFGLTVIAFFLLSRKIFIERLGELKADLIALISSFFLITIPVLLPRTIAGIPEKESVGFMFMFFAFYFFICSWKSKHKYLGYLHSILAAISTALMALVWGGYIYVYITIAVASGIAFIFGQVKRENAINYSIWWLLSFIIISFSTARYSLINLLTSTTTGLATAVFFIMLLDIAIHKTALKKYTESGILSKVPRTIIPIIIMLVLVILFSLLQPQYINREAHDILKNLVTPTVDRLGVTVAENRQPYYSEWAGSFGPPLSSLVQTLTLNIITLPEKAAQFLSSIPLFFWLFFIGSIFLFYHIFEDLTRKEKIFLTASYAIFLSGVVFSRFKPDHILNGVNSISIFFYLASFFLFVYIAGKKGSSNNSSGNQGELKDYYNTSAITCFIALAVWILMFRESFVFLIITVLASIPFFILALINIANQEHYRKADFGFLILFVLFFLSIVSARGAVRLIMVLVPPVSIIAAYFAVTTVSKSFSIKKEKRPIFLIIAALIVIASIFSGYQFYLGSKATAQSYVPSVYTQQWQYAMSWVRENTPHNAVFGHWWDYGYWVQSIGERATVLDGGNAIAYWNHMMGRYALTGPDSRKAAEFLFAHNATHFLIDSSDIGKYPAFSSIGSDERYDRSSWINSFTRNPTPVSETKNGTIYRYDAGGGIPLDEDVIFNKNGSVTRLPGGKAGIGAILVEQDSNGTFVSQPQGAFIYQNNLYQLPLRYAFFNKKLTDYGSGVEAGIFFFPKVDQSGQGFNVDNLGALLYLSNRTVKSQLARLYLYSQNDTYFKLVHTEDDIVVKQLKTVNSGIGDIVFFNGVRGPIRIWQITYPSNMTLNQSYLSVDYPESLRKA